MLGRCAGGWLAIFGGIGGWLAMQALACGSPRGRSMKYHSTSTNAGPQTPNGRPGSTQSGH